MRRYIKAAVSTSETVNFEGGLEKILSPETLDPTIMDLDNFSFSEDFMFTPNEPDSPYRSDFDNLLKFGAVLRNDEYYIPKGLVFSITCFQVETRSRNHIRYKLSRNGVSITEYRINDYDDLNVTFTMFGYRCFLASEDLNKPFVDVVKEMKVYASYFNLI